MTRLLERYPATASALPIAWDGDEITWGEWSTLAAFICARTLKKSSSACDQCGHESRVSLVIRGTIGDRQLMLLRCPGCGADTVVDWAQTVWELDESDYGPDGSWDAEDEPTLFTDLPQPQCSICGRTGEAAMTVDKQGARRCRDDDLCARRARARGKES